MNRLPSPVAVLAAFLIAMAGQVSAGHFHGYKQGWMAQPGFTHPVLGHIVPDTDPQMQLGVAAAAVPLADLDDMKIEHGVRIVRVIPGSAAETAGIRVDDVVTAYGDRPVYSPERLRHLVQTMNGATTVEVMRDNKALKLQTEVVSPDATEGRGMARLGIRVQPMSQDLREAFGADPGTGVLVSEVRSGNGAGDDGLRAGDILVAVAGEQIAGISDIRNVLADRTPGDTVNVDVIRDRTSRNLTVTLSAAPVPLTTDGKHSMLKHGGHGDGPHHGPYKGRG